MLTLVTGHKYTTLTFLLSRSVVVWAVKVKWKGFTSALACRSYAVVVILTVFIRVQRIFKTHTCKLGAILHHYLFWELHEKVHCFGQSFARVSPKFSSLQNLMNHLTRTGYSAFSTGFLLAQLCQPSNSSTRLFSCMASINLNIGLRMHRSLWCPQLASRANDIMFAFIM